MLFLVLDNFTVLADQRHSSVLMLGDGFQLGLQFLRVLNLPKQQWLCCNDLVRFLPLPQDRDARFDACFETFDDQKHCELRYNLYLSRAGFDHLLSYFSEFRLYVEHFKSLCDRGELVQRAPRTPAKHKNLFHIQDIVGEPPEDVNIPLFFSYLSLVQKPFSSLKFHSCMSTFFEKGEVADLLQSLARQRPQGDKALKSWDSFYLKYDAYTINILPKMQFKPQYHRLGDRVVFIFNSSKKANFGQTGTVIGIYKDKIEVVWDEPVIGGSSLNGRCPEFQGGVYQFFDLFNLSQWPKIVISQDHIKEYEKCWEGDYDLRGLFEMARTDEHRFFVQKKFVTALQDF